ncbi:MAG: SDR family oxidoreductase [Nitrospirota bacterium]
MSSNYRLLVTGGAGFIGSNTIEELLRQGHTVKVIDNFSTGKKENIEEFLDDIELITGDIRDKAVLRKAVEDVDFVIHLAALGSVQKSVADPVTTHDVNSTGTLNLLMASKETGVKRVVYASSSSVYGESPVLPKNEIMTPMPLSPYAVSKLIGEYYCMVFFHLYGLETVSLRYFNVYGKKQDPDSLYAAVIPKFVNTLLKGDKPVIYGDGEQSRDFTFIEDCVQATIKACASEKGVGKIFNVGYGESITINNLFKLISSLLGINSEPIYGEGRNGDIRHSLSDITRAREFLGYRPQYTIRAGIDKLISWYKSKSMI